MKKNVMTLILVGAMISGCSTLGQEEFDCPNNPNGYGCKGLKEVQELINQKTEGTQIFPVVGNVSGQAVDPKSVSFYDHSVINRSSEEQLHVWIAPFQDEQGNFHEPSVIHTVIRPSYWQMNSINWD